MILFLHDDIFNILISFCDNIDICNLFTCCKNLPIKNISLQNVDVKGFNVYNFIKWISRFGIQKVYKLKVIDYNFLNDHCMFEYKESCTCIQEITTVLESIKINTLVLENVRIDNDVINWCPSIKSLLLLNYCEESDLLWINKLRDLETLSIINYLEYREYEMFYVPHNSNIGFIRNGIQNPMLKFFYTNLYYFVTNLKTLVSNSVRNENLEVFSFDDLYTTRDELLELSKIISGIYPNADMMKIKYYSLLDCVV